MVRRAYLRWIFAALTALLVPGLALAAGVQALFDVSTPSGAPFPADRFAVPDDSHKTGLRIALPIPAECGASPGLSVCGDVQTLNTLDGFSLQPRISIPFSGPIDLASVTSENVFLLGPNGRRTGIEQIVWDPQASVLHVESDEMLEQHTRYVLIVTRGVRDVANEPVEAAAAFQAFRHGRKVGHADHHASVMAYRKALFEGIEVARAAGVDLDNVAVASVFTTQSITPVLEKIRDQLKASNPVPADFFLAGSGQPRTVFSVASIRDIQFRRQVNLDPGVQIPVAPGGRLPLLVGVDRIAFGKYSSPNYLRADRSFTPVGTRGGTPVLQGMEEIYFNLFLPPGTPPAAGWPVVIHGPGSPDTKNSGAYNMAAAAAARGAALISINGPGVGFGPASTLTVIPQTGASITFSAGGRSIDENGDGLIGTGVAPTSEGDEFLPRGSFIARRDVLRQAAADTMALVRLIEVGMDVDGDGVRDLDPARIYYQGWSFGANHGVLFAAVEPSVRAIGLNAPGGGVQSARLSPGNRPSLGRYLGRRVPSALNGPGISAFAGVATSQPLFNENLPLRTGLPLDVVFTDGTTGTIQSPVANPPAGAMEIQRILDHTRWALQVNDASAYARHLRARPLEGMPAKSVIMQMNRGDQTAPNTSQAAIARAGSLADRTMLYRHDLSGQALKNPHMVFIGTNDAALRSTARAQQDQLAILFESDGALFTDPDDYMAPPPSQPLFEAPIAAPLPEDLGFIP
jgi:Bacterial virulence factor lipase N-terminal